MNKLVSKPMNKPWILILGANSDMANAVAKKFAQTGHNLYLASRNIAELNKTASDLHLRYDIQAEARHFDARDYGSHQAFYDALKIKPEGLIVAFGSMYEQADAQNDFSLAIDMIESNYSGAVSIIEIVAKDFEASDKGFIVGISSVAGDRGRQSNYIYGSSKAAFSTYLNGLRHRLYKTDVHVLTVKPGFVATKMTAHLDLPEKLTAQPEEVANRIYDGAQKKKLILYIKPVWRLIMLIIAHVPAFIFNRTKL